MHCRNRPRAAPINCNGARAATERAAVMFRESAIIFHDLIGEPEVLSVE
jgi:hypothetical protein